MNSPSIRVGIMSAESITIVFHGHYSVDGVSVPSGVPQVFDLSSGIGKIYIPDDPQECFFEVHGVTIGVGFHWERREDQKFRGSVSFIREGDQITLVNVVDAEECQCAGGIPESACRHIAQLVIGADTSPRNGGA